MTMRWIIFLALVLALLTTAVDAQEGDPADVAGLEEYAASIASLQQQIGELRQRNQELEQYGSTMQQREQQLQTDIGGLQQREQQWQQTVQQLNEEKSHLENSFREVQMQANEAAEVRTSLEARVAQVEAFAAEANGKMQESIQQATALQNELDAIKEERGGVVAQVDALEAEKAQLNLKLQEMEALVSSLESASNAAKEDSARLSAELVQSRKKEQAVQSQMVEHAETVERTVQQHGTCQSALQQKQDELAAFLRKSPDRHLGRALLSVLKSIRYIFLRMLGFKPK